MHETNETTPHPQRDPAQIENARAFAIAAARMLRDDKAEHVLVLDVQNLSRVTDFIVIGSGTSQRQMATALDHIEELAKDFSYTRHRTNRDDQSLWLLADFVDVVVHLFEPNTRAHYDLEMLWGDAPRIEWNQKTA